MSPWPFVIGASVVVLGGFILWQIRRSRVKAAEAKAVKEATYKVIEVSEDWTQPSDPVINFFLENYKREVVGFVATRCAIRLNLALPTDHCMISGRKTGCGFSIMEWHPSDMALFKRVTREPVTNH